ncbi:MAG: hypothetical protein ABI846_14630 [Rudaea sp.]
MLEGFALNLLERRERNLGESLGSLPTFHLADFPDFFDGIARGKKRLMTERIAAPYHWIVVDRVEIDLSGRGGPWRSSLNRLRIVSGCVLLRAARPLSADRQAACDIKHVALHERVGRLGTGDYADGQRAASTGGPRQMHDVISRLEGGLQRRRAQKRGNVMH